MRLYRVESFYAFLLRFRSEGSEEEERPATASLHAGPATHGQGQPARGDACGHGGLRPARKGDACGHGRHLRAPPYSMPASGCCQRLARKGLPPPAKLQGVIARGAPARGATTSDQPARGCRPWPALSPT
ncbi:hypothetical protein GW17_00041352 [Ensete ventricosum]|nr:hypothetical protein GW17_00041352 [Ensete ventricosum]